MVSAGGETVGVGAYRGATLDSAAASAVALDELAISILGRPDLAELWERVRTGRVIEDPCERTLVLLAESRAHERAGRLDDACTTARIAIERATAVGDAIGVAGGRSHLSYACYRLRRLEEATKLAEEALGPPHPHTVTALLVLGLVATDACRWDEARERFLLARTWSTEIGYPLGVMLALHNLSVVYFHTGRFDLAVAAANDVGRLNAEIRYPGWAYPWTRAIAAQIIGDREAARRALDELAAVDPPAAFASTLGRTLEAQLALDEEDIDEAEHALLAARLDAERMGNPMVRAMVLLVTSRVRRARDDPASALGWIDEAIEEVARSGLATLDGWMQLERARVLWALGDEAGAAKTLRVTKAAADARSAAHVAAEASVLMAALATKRGDGDAGQLWVEAASRVRLGGYGFLLERERTLAAPQLAALARDRSDTETRRVGQEMLHQLARTAPVPIRVVALGRFEVSQGRRSIPNGDLSKRRAGELFRFLLLQRQRRAPRDVVIEALWPDHPADRATALFHQASSMLRRVLEPDLPDKFPSRYVRLTGDAIELVLPTGSTIDFERFEWLVTGALREPTRATAALSDALKVYGGELFPGDRYVEWTAARRAKLGDLAAAAGVALGEALLAEGDARAALDACVVAIERDPLNEGAVAVGMRAALALGDRIAAMRMYRQCERQLADELGVAPSTVLRDLATGIGA